MIEPVDMTPELPSEIRDFTDPQKSCTNVYEILPDETKLYGTESLVDESGVTEPTWKYGYWKSAELLLLAQDASDAAFIDERRSKQHPDPFCAFDWRFDKGGKPQRDGMKRIEIFTGSPNKSAVENSMGAPSLDC